MSNFKIYTNGGEGDMTMTDKTAASDDLVSRLRALAHAEHDDHSVADEAADEIERLRKALRPFSAAVFNDNGDVTISTGHLTTQDWLGAHAALKENSRASVLDELMAADADFIDKD